MVKTLKLAWPKIAANGKNGKTGKGAKIVGAA